MSDIAILYGFIFFCWGLLVALVSKWIKSATRATSTHGY